MTSSTTTQKTIKVDITFSSSFAGEAVRDDNDAPGPTAILQNIELCHLPEWKVDEFRIVNDDTSSEGDRNKGSSSTTTALLKHLVIGFIVCVLAVSTNNGNGNGATNTGRSLLFNIIHGTSSLLFLSYHRPCIQEGGTPQNHHTHTPALTKNNTHP